MIETSRVRSKTSLFVFAENSELEVSPKTFKVCRFAGRPTAISGLVENRFKKTTRTTSLTTKQ